MRGQSGNVDPSQGKRVPVRGLQPLRKLIRAFDSGVEGSLERSAVRFLDRRLLEHEEPLLGAHIISPRRGYLHHGIYVGNGRVVHYAGLAYGLYHAPVEEVSLAQFARGRGIWARWRPAAFERAEIVRRARSRVGEARYRILHNNCEHFCEWCVHGEARSYQIERLMSSRRALTVIVMLIARWEACCAGLLPLRNSQARCMTRPSGDTPRTREARAALEVRLLASALAAIAWLMRWCGGVIQMPPGSGADSGVDSGPEAFDERSLRCASVQH